jgi:hypothetical protein
MQRRDEGIRINLEEINKTGLKNGGDGVIY